MVKLVNALIVRFTATPLGFNIYAMVMYADPALLAVSVVGVQRIVNFLMGLL